MLWVEMSGMADPVPPPPGSVHPGGMDLHGDPGAVPSADQNPLHAPKPGAAQAPCPCPCQCLLCALQGLINTELMMSGS